MNAKSSHHHLEVARSLRDGDLLAYVAHLAGVGRGVTAELVAHLAEVDARKLHLGAGYSSLFSYCCEVLRLSEHAAYHRIEAARAVRRFPVILDGLAEGDLNLTTVRLLARQLTEENHREVLERARGLSKAEVEKLVATLAPRPDVPTSVFRLPAPTSSETVAAVEVVVPVAMPVAPTVTADPPVATVRPLSPERYKMQLTISGDTLEKLRLAKDLLRHAIPSGNEAEILDRALTLLVADLARKKFAETKRPRFPRGQAEDSRNVPAEVKRQVFLRDLGRCAFVGHEGRRCRERGFLEFHHVRPFSEGGPPTPENIELRCRRHNLYEWERQSIQVRMIEEEWLRSTWSGPSWRSRKSSERLHAAAPPTA